MQEVALGATPARVLYCPLLAEDRKKWSNSDGRTGLQAGLAKAGQRTRNREPPGFSRGEHQQLNDPLVLRWREARLEGKGLGDGEFVGVRTQGQVLDVFAGACLVDVVAEAVAEGT